MEVTVAFKYKDYRIEGRARQKIMRLTTDEFIRRFLIHVPANRLHRIRHYGLFASGVRAQNIARARELLVAAIPREQDKPRNDADKPEPRVLAHPCPCCGGRMIVIRTRTRFARLFARRTQDRHIMIEIASSAAPQLGSLLPLVVRPHRSRSPKDPPADSPSTAAENNIIP